MGEYYTPPEASSVVGLADTYLRWRHTQEGPRGFEMYHPSALGKCLRMMQYERYAERGYIPAPTKEMPDPMMLRIWENGHHMHARWAKYFEEIGVLRGVWECANPICQFFDDEGVIRPDDMHLPAAGLHSGALDKPRRYGQNDLQGAFKPKGCGCGCTTFNYHEVTVHSDELNFHGHCDMILDFSRFDPERFSSVQQSYMIENLPKRPIVVDMKTINHFDFQEVAEGVPHPEYLTQLMVYANMLDCEYGILIYENKNNQKTCSFKVERSPDHLWQEVIRQAREMNEMVEVLDDDGETVLHLLPPPRPKMREDKKCNRCAFRETCHASSVWDAPDLEQQRKEFYGDLL